MNSNSKTKISWINFLPRYLLLFAIIFNASIIKAEQVENALFESATQQKLITISVTNKSLKDVLYLIKAQSGLNFIYKNSDKLDNLKPLSVNFKNLTVDQALDLVLKNTGFVYSKVNNAITIYPKESSDVSNGAQKGSLLTGRIVDEKGNPLHGAAVVVNGTNIGTASDSRGNFSIKARVSDVLIVTFIGYKDHMELVKGIDKKLTIALKSSAANVDEITVVAFGEQKKESLVSAITTINPSSLKSSSSDLTTQFAGKIAGVIGWQTGGIPGALTEDEMNTKFYVRGITSFQKNANIEPLVLIDNVESSKVDLARIASEDIETFSVMKDASATAMYGARGANGVILVTTKKGQEGNVYTSVRYEAINSQPTRKIDVIDPIEYMHMYNQALMSRNTYAMPKYSVERIERTGSPKYPSFIYPANDWYKQLFKDFSVNHHAGVNIRGGSKIMQYYASVNYNFDQGMLKTDKLNDFDCNIKNHTINYRVNLNVDLAPGARLVLNSTANLDKYHGPAADVRQAYGMAFQASPVDFAVMYPADDYYSWPHLRFGTRPTGGNNPYASIQSGYNERNRYSATNRLEYIQNLAKLVKGLELRGSVALNKTGYYSIDYTTKPGMYACGPDNYDFETGKHTLQQIVAPNRILGSGTPVENQRTQLTYELRALHSAAWGNHQTSLTGVFAAQETTHSDVRSVLDGVPNRNLGLSMRGSYGYKDRYFAEASFGYNGSERFAKQYRWGFFPAVGCAWIISKEPWLANNTSKWLDLLKVRLSWGQVGNDGVINNPRYAHLPELSYMNVTGPLPGQMGGSRPLIITYPNEKIQWEIAEQMNLGLETKFFGGILEATVDIYQEIRHNILDYRIDIPSSVGVEMMQLANVGTAKSQGLDLSVKCQHAFTPDYWMILNGTFTYSKATFLEIQEAIDKPAWQKKVGQELSQSVGYIAEGLFKDQAEIDNSPFQGGDVMPGDIRYRDLNNDGVINVSDATHIGFPETPRVIYGFSAFFNLKAFEVNMSFQGSGKRTFFMDPMKIAPFVGGRAMLREIYNDHWSSTNMSERPFWPRLSDQPINVHNPQENWNSGIEQRKSTYFMRECSFLRCTSLEVAYNMPEKLMKKIKMSSLKLYARCNNPFMISNFKVWDVELGNSGFNYPIQRTFSLGLNLSF